MFSDDDRIIATLIWLKAIKKDLCGKDTKEKSQWKEGSKSIYIQILEFIKNIVFSHHPHIKLFFNGKMDYAC